MRQYHKLLDKVLEEGELRPSRVGATYSLFGESMDWDMRHGFPALTTRQLRWKPVLGELAAFLEGADHVSQFKAKGCNYWDADAARWNKQGYLGRIYGVQWRGWRAPDGHKVDQLRDLITGLIHDPYGRRHILSAWNPGETTDMALPPCHVLAQFYVSQDSRWLDLQVYMRSVDLCLGLPADLMLYGALQHLVANEIGIATRRLRFVFGDAHIYANHAETWQLQSARKPTMPPIWSAPRSNGLFNFDPTDVALIGYEPHEPLKYQLNT